MRIHSNIFVAPEKRRDLVRVSNDVWMDGLMDAYQFQLGTSVEYISSYLICCVVVLFVPLSFVLLLCDRFPPTYHFYPSFVYTMLCTHPQPEPGPGRAALIPEPVSPALPSCPAPAPTHRQHLPQHPATMSAGIPRKAVGSCRCVPSEGAGGCVALRRSTRLTRLVA